MLECVCMSTQVQQVDLWGKEGLKYSVEHARAKLAMLGGGATREEEERQVEAGARDDNLDEIAVNVDLRNLLQNYIIFLILTLHRFAPVMTAAEEVNKMDIVLIGDWIIFCTKYLPISVCSHPNVELQCALPTETVD